MNNLKNFTILVVAVVFTLYVKEGFCQTSYQTAGNYYAGSPGVKKEYPNFLSHQIHNGLDCYCSYPNNWPCWCLRSDTTKMAPSPSDPFPRTTTLRTVSPRSPVRRMVLDPKNQTENYTDDPTGDGSCHQN